MQTAQGRFPRIQIATVANLLDGKRPELPQPIETDAFKQPLRPMRRVQEEAPEAQLALTLPIPGKGKRKDTEEYLSGRLLAGIMRSSDFLLRRH